MGPFADFFAHPPQKQYASTDQPITTLGFHQSQDVEGFLLLTYEVHSGAKMYVSRAAAIMMFNRPSDVIPVYTRCYHNLLMLSSIDGEIAV